MNIVLSLRGNYSQLTSLREHIVSEFCRKMPLKKKLRTYAIHIAIWSVDIAD